MRRALVIGRKQDEVKFSTLVQPTDPRSANDAYKALLAKPGDLAEMELWESHPVKRKKFAAAGSPAAAPASPATPAPQPPAPATAPDLAPEVAESDDGPSLLAEPPKPKSKK